MKPQITWADGVTLSWQYFYLPKSIDVACAYKDADGQTKFRHWDWPAGTLVRSYTGSTSGFANNTQWNSPKVETGATWYYLEKMPKKGGYWDYYPNGSSRENEKGYAEDIPTRYDSRLAWTKANPSTFISVSGLDFPASLIDQCGGDKMIPKKWWSYETAKGSGGESDDQNPDNGKQNTSSSTPMILAAIAVAAFFLYRKGSK